MAEFEGAAFRKWARSSHLGIYLPEGHPTFVEEPVERSRRTRLDMIQVELRQLKGLIPRERAGNWRNLARDVWVNLVANLLAGAILYVAAVTAGYLRGNPTLLILSALIIAPGLALLVLLFASGLQYIISAGDTVKIFGAKDRLIRSTFGLLLLGTVFAGTKLGAALHEFKPIFQIVAVEAILVAIVLIGGMLFKQRRFSRFYPKLVVAFLISAALLVGLLAGLLIPYLW